MITSMFLGPCYCCMSDEQKAAWDKANAKWDFDTDTYTLGQLQQALKGIVTTSKKLKTDFAREHVINWVAENKAWIDSFITEREKKQ